MSYICPWCSSDFATQHGLISHIGKMHDQRPPRPKPVPEKQLPPEPAWKSRVCEGYRGHVCTNFVKAPKAKLCPECSRQRHVLNARAYQAKHRVEWTKRKHSGAQNVVYLESQERRHDRKCRECGKPCWPNYFKCKQCSRPSYADEDWLEKGYGI